MPTTKFATYRNNLHSMRHALDARADELRAEAFQDAGGESVGDLSIAPIHSAELACHESEASVNVGLAENEALLRQEIDEALRRLDDGAFGRCEKCNHAISAERLAAVPYARHCIHCAD